MDSTTGAAAPVEDHLVDAEDCLQRGMVEDASRLARKVLQQPAGPTTAEKARALNVLIQADFHFENRLIDLEQLLEESGLALEQLPVTAVLLWGVVAVELEAADEARALLRRYLDTKNFGEGSDVTREDALALSRLYAVQLLSGLCGNFQAAADWLTDGGAGLSEEQQELLLLEVDEAEELAQEEHVAEWTSQAAHLGTHAHLHNGAAAGSAGAAGAYSDAVHECGVTDSASAVGSIASTAAAALHELGPSVSGVLSLHPADSSMSHEHDFDSAMSHERAASAAADAAPSRSSAGSDGSSNHSGSAAAKASPASAAAAAGAQLEAAAAAVAAAEARLAAVSSPLSSPAATAPAGSVPPAVAVAVAVRGLEDSERVPSSPSLASWRRSPDEVAVQDQEGQRGGANSVNSSSSNAFVTITGAFNDQGYDPEVVAALAAEAAATAAGAGSGSGSGSQRGPSSPQKGGKAQVARASTTSSSSSDIRSRLRSAASDVAAAAAAAVATAVANGQAAVAAVTGSEASAPADSTSQEQQQQEQQQEEEGEAGAAEGTQEGQGQQSWVQSYASWASDKASETWQSQPVQDAIKALNLQDVPAWELASGAAAAVLLTYGLYRNRRRVRRAAADFAAGVSQTARMALGVSVNPMAAVPGIGHR